MMVLNKYHNTKVIVDGIRFDSKKEGERYKELKLLEKMGIIDNLRLQVPFEIQPSFKFNGKTIRAITYVADFCYFDNEKNKMIIEDTKGYKNQVYLIKRKMMMYKGFEIIEI